MLIHLAIHSQLSNMDISIIRPFAFYVMNYLSVRQALPVGDIILVNIIQNFKHIGVSIQIYVQEAWGGGTKLFHFLAS